MSGTENEAELSAENFTTAYVTPLSTKLWTNSDDLNSALRAAILRRESENGGVSRSNIGGWHSAADLLTWNMPETGALRDRFLRTAAEMTRYATANQEKRRIGLKAEAWANVSRRGNYNTVHDHPRAMWSAVYYVSAGEPDGENPRNGRLEFVDPRVGINTLHLENGVFGARYVIDPIPGLLVMFPSWLKHFVHPFEGEGERISIASNIFVDAEPTKSN